MCASVCAFVCELGGRFTAREASVTAINVTSLQTLYGALREACVCNLVTSSGFVVENCRTITPE